MLPTRTLIAAVLIASFAPAAPALAQTQAPTVAPSERAMELVKILQPRDLNVAAAVRLGEQTFRQAFARSAGDVARMEAALPGIVDGAWLTMKPLLVVHINAMMPLLWNDLASLYSSRFTDAEIGRLAIFYAGPTGQKIIRQMSAGFDAKPSIAEMIAHGDSQLSAKTLNEGTRRAARGIGAVMGLEDASRLAELTRVVPMAKLSDAGAASQAVVLKWVNKKDPAFDAKVEAALSQFMKDFTKKLPTARK